MHQTHLGSVIHVRDEKQRLVAFHIVCVIDKKAMGEDNSYLNVKQKYASQLLGTLRYSGRGRGGRQLVRN